MAHILLWTDRKTEIASISESSSSGCCCPKERETWGYNTSWGMILKKGQAKARYRNDGQTIGDKLKLASYQSSPLITFPSFCFERERRSGGGGGGAAREMGGALSESYSCVGSGPDTVIALSTGQAERRNRDAQWPRLPHTYLL